MNANQILKKQKYLTFGRGEYSNNIEKKRAYSDEFDFGVLAQLQTAIGARIATRASLRVALHQQGTDNDDNDDDDDDDREKPVR
jgi:hypothetical protein